MKWSLNEISKKKKIDFELTLDLSAALKARAKEIIDVKEISAIGQVSYDDQIYLLDYQIHTTLILPSSRSLKPVEYPIALVVNEAFAKPDGNLMTEALMEEELIIPLEKDGIDLDESIEDNILLEIPLQVLAKDEQEEEKLPAGQFWSVMSEETYRTQNEAKEAEKKSPFAQLDGLFD
ncbi:DUF177 domain-containing protein [Lactococcus hircilactis]|uniref:DUF177 domain-containing protein n=1 Tax=Lactococcus hircilactis TaxID=1494462 RepID=A0A7X2D020_9LACT|nr:DUF177 domain-containing protein [Lactococcus hircilactis]MQW39279.1 DUF177 domain-containing protein [Lactococcus hircilactis]